MLDSLILLFGVLIPPILYAIIIWMTMPYSTIKIKEGLKYFVLGCVSTSILTFMWALLPNYFGEWQLGLFGDTADDFYITKAFFKVAYPEELSKYLAFFIITLTRR